MENSTIHVPPKIIAPKRVKQIGTMTSQKHATNITMIVAVIATVYYVVPMLIFPCIHCKNHMLKGIPNGSIG